MQQNVLDLLLHGNMYGLFGLFCLSLLHFSEEKAEVIKMREILFRGKRKDNGNWILGSLLNFRENTYIIPHNSEYCYDDTEKLAFDVEYFEVSFETVGQYTGLTDKNGKKIFEGDILIWGFEIYIITYIEEYGQFLGTNGEAKYGLTPADESEVIGNIHDNPELLKGEI